MHILSLVGPIFQQVAGLAVQRLADGFQRGKTDGAYLAVFQFGEVDIGNAYPLGKFVQEHFSVGHDPVQS